MSNKITTPGAIFIKHMLPKDSQHKFDLYTPIDKPRMSGLVKILVEDKGGDSHNILNDYAKMFFNKSTEIGSTTPLADYFNESDERQAQFSELENRVTEVLKKNLPKLEQAKELDKIAVDMKGKVEKANIQYMLSRGSTAAKMAAAGARGNLMNMGQSTASPIMGADIKGIPLPVAIKHSFAEGLSNAEHLAMSYGGRASTVMSQLSTEKPGALFKKLTPAVFHEVIMEADCGSRNGVPIPLSDRLSCIGRYEAVTNKLIDEAYYKELHASGHKTVTARNPMTCKAKQGLCQKCYGLTATGQLPFIGQNMGIIAAQSVSEVLTQLMLSTKHSGGVAGRQRNPYEEANNVLTNPENFQDEATIAKTNGLVQSIKKTSLKDHEIVINGEHHFVPNIQEPTISVGDKVRVGDLISTGTANPRELVNLKGAGAGRVYLAGKMREIYSRNAQLDPRHFDVIARNMIKYYEIVEPGESGFLPGDRLDVGVIGGYLREHSKVVPVDSSLNHTLADFTLDLSPGTLLTQNHIDDLKAHNISQVSISESGLKVKALVPGLQSLKMLDKNWVSKLSFNRLHTTIQEAAALGSTSPIHSTEPIASYVMGSEFGEGKDGRY